MKFFRRSFIALGLAAMLPILVAVSGAIYVQVRAEPERLKADALARSRTIISLVDAQIRLDAALLNVLSSSVYFETHDWAEFYVRLQRIKATNPAWVTLRVYDTQNGVEILDLRRPMSEPRPAQLSNEQLQRLQQASGLVVSGISRNPEPVVEVLMPVRQHGQMTYVLALDMNPKIYQDILLEYTLPGVTSAVVDRHGVFVARSVNYELRVGTPATTYLRNAIASGASGSYQGVTYEGLKNYTAFFVSPSSGWSAHVAIPWTTLSLFSSWSFLVVVFTALGGAVLAVVLVRVVKQDMEERRINEEALRQSQKMEAVGQLTGGIAHDFNNLLTPLLGNLDLIRTQASDNPMLRRLAENALEAARRGAKLSARLMSFSRIQRLQLKPVDLKALLQSMDVLLRQSISPTIELHTEIAADANLVLTDANQLELALLNLAVNARDAMPEGGTLSITARRAQRKLRQLSRREFVEICVSDTGRGMSEEVRQHALEPFFTTKSMGHGTGLGLSQVYGVMRESGGLMEIQSEPDAGTQIYLYLPAVISMPRSADANPATVPMMPVVLVVDDDAEVGQFLHAALSSWGYRVTTLVEGEAALQLLEQQPVDLLIIDFAMSKMNGAEVARAALQLRPALRILMVSGHSDSAIIKEELGEVKLLQKPFDLQQLRTTVENVLGNSAE